MWFRRILMRYWMILVLVMVTASLTAEKATTDSVLHFIKDFPIEQQIDQLNRISYQSDIPDTLRIQLSTLALIKAEAIGDMVGQKLALNTQIVALLQEGRREEARAAYQQLRQLLEQEKHETEKQISSQIFFRNIFMLGFVLILNMAFWAYKRYVMKKKDTDSLAKVNDEYRERAKELERTNLNIERAKKQLEGLARTDPLTRLLNRRGMEERIHYEIQRFKRYSKPFAVIISDIDDFKKVNDTYGHNCGDYVLTCVSELISDVIRKIDIACRWGGEEFLLLLPETDLEGGGILAEKLKDLISITPYQFEGIDIQFSMTFGVSVFDGGKNIDVVIQEADEALYYGKEHGKDQVVLHGRYGHTQVQSTDPITIPDLT